MAYSCVRDDEPEGSSKFIIIIILRFWGHVYDCRGHYKRLKKGSSLFISVHPLDIQPMNRGPNETTAC